MEKKMILLLMTLLLPCLLFASCTSDSETTSKTSSEMAESSEVSVAESNDMSIFEPIDVPEVVTRSHMVEKVGEDADLIQEALKLYAGQDTKYRVQVNVNWNDRDVHLAFHSLINFTECYECGKYGNSEQTGTDQKKVSETLYHDPTRYLEADTLAIPDLFAELNEESIRTLLNCEGVTVTLIDELPEQLVPYNAPAAEPDDPSVEESGDIDVIPFPSGSGSWDFMTKDLRSYEGMSPEEALQAFLEQYENYSGTDWARIGCSVKISISTEATAEAREALIDTMRTYQRRTYQADKEHEYALLAKIYCIPSADGLITEYYADATAQAIRALQSIKGVTIVARNYEDIPDSAVECKLYED